MIENEDEIIQNLKKLASKSNERFHDEIMNMKDSRNFAGGEQSLELSKSRLKSKANLIPRIINTIVNPIRSNPYTVDYSPVSQDFSGYIPRISEFCYEVKFKGEFNYTKEKHLDFVMNSSKRLELKCRLNNNEDISKLVLTRSYPLLLSTLPFEKIIKDASTII